MSTVRLLIDGKEIISFRSRMDSELANISAAIDRARGLGYDLRLADMGKTFDINIY